MEEKKQQLQDELARALGDKFGTAAANDDVSQCGSQLNVSQTINGNNNQVNQSVHFAASDEFDPENPNIIECPCCWKPASKYAICIRCNYDIPAHFHSIEVERRVARLNKHAKGCMIGCGSCFLLNMLTGSSLFFIGAIAFLGIAIALSQPVK